MRLIDADALMEEYRKIQMASLKMQHVCITDEAIDNAPTVDAVPVVRCKDCKHSIDYYNDGECYCRHPRYHGETLLYIEDGYWHYCSFGERKDNG